MKKLDVEDWAVKAVKSGEHDHGYFFSGNLYRGARKVAEFTESGWGGPMDIRYLDDDAESDFMSLAHILQGDEYSEADAILIMDMVNEYEFKKKVKRDRKKKTYFTVYIDDEDTTYALDTPYSERAVKMILNEKGDIVIANEEFDIYPDGVEKVYRDE